MVAAGMGNSRGRFAVLAVSALALAGAGCGEDRQDADAPSGEFDVEVTDASFPPRQRIAEPSTLRLEVANRGDRAVPNLAVIVETQPGTEGQAPAAFGQDEDDPTLADSKRPVWIVDEGPSGRSAGARRARSSGRSRRCRPAATRSAGVSPRRSRATSNSPAAARRASS